MSARTSQGAIAWAISLNTFPYLAVPAYWVLGRSRFQGYVTARQEGDHEIRQVLLKAREATLHLRSSRSQDVPSNRAAERIAKVPTLRENQVELLVDGEATFADIFAGIDKARDLIGWTPQYGGLEGFKRGLAETAAWFAKPENLTYYKADRYNI